mgnify:FL=1|jgi:ribonuclease-3 family protein
MQEFHHSNCDPKLLSPGTLAFLGDAVYELFVRQQLVETANMPVNKLHLLAVEKVRASFQSNAYSIIEPQLTEEEQTIWKRGRNANGVKAPKHADPVEYRRATGLETLFGYLFLQGKMDRLEELFQMILSADEAEQK